MGREATENSRPEHCHKILRVFWSSLTHVPKAVTDKAQAYPTPKNMKDVQDFVGNWGFRGLLLSTWHGASLP